jgi:glucan phosphoethanolaminetransferase (alkaline phosphatase superfamily)
MNEVGSSIKSGNAVKSQIYIALICYLSLEFIRRKTKKKIQSFLNFVEKIRICLTFYLSLNYIWYTISDGAKKIKSDKPIDSFT